MGDNIGAEQKSINILLDARNYDVRVPCYCPLIMGVS